MASSGVAQINARLPRSLKESGDAGLKELGISPSDAIRSLWRRLSERGEALRATKDFLLGMEDAPTSEQPSLDTSPLVQGWHMVDAYWAQFGLQAPVEKPYSTTAVQASDSELLAQAMEERLSERGLT